jgi:hypothetical protein
MYLKYVRLQFLRASNIVHSFTRIQRPFSCLLTTNFLRQPDNFDPGNISDISALVQIYKRTHTPLDQSHEKLSFGGLLHRPCDGLSTCFWLYSPARYPLEK